MCVIGLSVNDNKECNGRLPTHIHTTTPTKYRTWIRTRDIETRSKSPFSRSSPDPGVADGIQIDAMAIWMTTRIVVVIVTMVM